MKRKKNNVLDDMEEDFESDTFEQIQKPKKTHQIAEKDDLSSEIAKAKQNQMAYRDHLYSSSGVIIEGIS